jgi:TPP-dependent pyruvate/acetoin dehydrogenase alpha subunit
MIREIEERIHREVDEAAHAAEHEPYPDAAGAGEGVYAP